MENIVIIFAISVFITVSPFISKFTKIPVSVVEMLLGSYAAYIGIIGESSALEVIAKVGFLYLMFLAGMEVDLKSFLSLDRSFVLRALKYFFTVYCLSFCFYLYFDLPPLYIVILPVISVGMIMTLIKEYGKEIEWLKTALIVGVLGELISIGALVITDGILAFGFGWKFYGAMATLIIFLLLTALFFRLIKIVFWWFPEIQRAVMPESDNKNQDIRISIAVFFIMISMMLYLELELVLGAFLAGMFINTFFEHKKELPHKLSSFGFGFLVPIFFIYVGSTLDVGLIFSDFAILSKAAYVVMAMIGMHLLSSYLTFSQQFGKVQSVMFGLSLSMPLTFLVAIATIGYHTQSISKEDYFSLITASMLEAIFVMVAIKLIKFATIRFSSKDLAQ